MKKTYIIVAAVVFIIAAFVGLSYFQSSTKKTNIGFAGAKDLCLNVNLQTEYKNMGYNVTCYGQDLGSSDLLKLPGDPTVGSEIDVIIASSIDANAKLKDAFGKTQYVGDYTTLFGSPMLPLIKAKDAHVLIEAGLAEKRGNYLFVTNETLAKIYAQQATGKATWGDLGVTDPEWKNARVLVSSANPFVSGTGWNGYNYDAACLGTINIGEVPCSRAIDYNMLTPQLKEQMRGLYASYGSQSEDGNTLNYMKQWMYGSNKVLMIMGNESFPMLFAASQNNPKLVEDMLPVYTTYGYMTSQYANSVSKDGEKFIKDILANPKVAEIVNRELGSRMGYTYSTLAPTAASWVPASDPMTYIQLPSSDVKAPLLCYVGQAERVSAKLMWTTTFGKKTDASGNKADDGRTFEESITDFCSKNQ